MNDEKHSSAYIDFKKQLSATGSERLDGYYPELLDHINENEREEIEKDIWTHFVNKDDAELSVFMPFLREYDGIGALTKKLPAFKVPSSGSAEIAFVLFDVTEDKRYLDVIMDNYRGLSLNTPIAVKLARFAKKPHVYQLHKDIYIHDENETNRLQAILGILWHDGKIDRIDDTDEFSRKLDLIRAFDLDSAEAREKLILTNAQPSTPE